MSTGPAGSAYAAYAEQYRRYLADKGIELVLRSSGGASDNLERLSQVDSDVDVAFITMGSPGEADQSQLRSLGAMFFEPMWLFTTDPGLSSGNLASIQNLRISIGPDLITD